MEGLIIEYNKMISSQSVRKTSSHTELAKGSEVKSGEKFESGSQVQNLPKLDITLAASCSSPCLSTPTSHVPQTVLKSPHDCSGSIAGVVLAAWDNIMGPRVLYMWKPAPDITPDVQDCTTDPWNSALNHQDSPKQNQVIASFNAPDHQDTSKNNQVTPSVNSPDSQNSVKKNHMASFFNQDSENGELQCQKVGTHLVTNTKLNTMCSCNTCNSNALNGSSGYLMHSNNGAEGDYGSSSSCCYDSKGKNPKLCKCVSDSINYGQIPKSSNLECDTKQVDEIENGLNFCDKIFRSSKNCSNDETVLLDAEQNSTNQAHCDISRRPESCSCENLVYLLKPNSQQIQMQLQQQNDCQNEINPDHRNISEHNNLISNSKISPQFQQQNGDQSGFNMDAYYDGISKQNDLISRSINSDEPFILHERYYEEDETSNAPETSMDCQTEINLDAKDEIIFERGNLTLNCQISDQPFLLHDQQNEKSDLDDAPEEFLNADLMRFIATHTLCGEIGRDADSPCIDAKFHVAPEKCVAMETRIFGANGNWEGMLGRAAGRGARGGGSIMSIHSLSVVFRHNHLPVVLKWKSVCSEWLNRSARLLQVAVHENFEVGCSQFCEEFSKFLRTINLITRSSVPRNIQLHYTALHPGHFDLSFVHKAIVAHLYQSQRSVVIGRSANKVNLMIATLSLFVNDSAKHRCVYVSDPANHTMRSHGNHDDSCDDSSIRAVFSPELDVQGFVINDDVCKVAPTLLGGGVYDGPAPVALIDVHDCRVWSLCPVNAFKGKKVVCSMERVQRVFRGLSPDPPYTKSFSSMFDKMDYVENTVTDLMTHLSLLPMTHLLRESYIRQYMSHLQRRALAVILLVKQKTNGGRKSIPASELFVIMRKTFSLQSNCDLMILLALAERLKPGFVEYVFSSSDRCNHKF